MASETKQFTLEEVKQKSSSSQPLLVISNSVYDVTSFLNEVRMILVLIIARWSLSITYLCLIYSIYLLYK